MPATPTTDPGDDHAPLSVGELILAYFRFAHGHYVKHGRPTSEQGYLKQALRPVRKLYASTPAAEFGPRALKNVREAMVAAGRARTSVNKDVHRIKRVVRWAVGEELLPAAAYERLRCVAALAEGKSAARETDRVLPVPEGDVRATLPHLPPPVAAMAELQLLTGARPQEVIHLRPGDLTAGDGVWYYAPSVHKTQHMGRDRCVVLGPRAMAVLGPFLARDPQAYCFSPAEAVAWQRARRAKRTGANRPPAIPLGDLVNPKYTRHSYLLAIRRACRRAKVPAWTPRQLRHIRATQIRQAFGSLEAAKAVLGHADTRVTGDLRRTRPRVGRRGDAADGLTLSGGPTVSPDPIHPAGDPRAALPAFHLGLTVSDLLHTIPWCHLNAGEDDEIPPSRLGRVVGELIRHAGELSDLGTLSPSCIGDLTAAERLRGATRDVWQSAEHREWISQRQELEGSGVLHKSRAEATAFARGPLRSPWEEFRVAAGELARTLPEGVSALFDLGRAVGEVQTTFEHYQGAASDPVECVHGVFAGRVDRLLSIARRHYQQLAEVRDLPSGADAGGAWPYEGMVVAILSLAEQIPSALATSGVPSADDGRCPQRVHAAEATPAPPPAADPTPPVTPAPVIPASALPQFPQAKIPLARRDELCRYLHSLQEGGALAGESDAWLHAVDEVRRFARGSGWAILLLGESGAGKSVLGELVHNAVLEAQEKGESRRVRSASVTPTITRRKQGSQTAGSVEQSSSASSRCRRWQASCIAAEDQAIPRGELLGYAPNSGLNVGTVGRPGKVEVAAGGTLFVDEFGDLSSHIQLLLLDVVERKPCSRIGGGVSFVPDVVMVFATNKDVGGDESIRRDLLYRIPTQLIIPSLRERPDDLFPIVQSILRGQSRPDFRTWELLLRYPWPGNVRELSTVLRKVADDQGADCEAAPQHPIRQERPILPYESFARDRRFASILPHVGSEPEAEQTVLRWAKQVLTDRGYKPRSKQVPLGKKLSEWLGITEANASRLLSPPSSSQMSVSLKPSEENVEIADRTESRAATTRAVAEDPMPSVPPTTPETTSE